MNYSRQAFQAMAGVVHNLFLFFGLRDRRYLWYVGFILSTAAFFTTLNGLHLEWIPHLSPRTTGMLATTFLGTLAALALQFTRRFLGTAEMDPRLDPWLKFGIAVPLGGIVLNVLMPEGIVVLYMSAMGLVTTALFFTATLRAAVFRHFRPAYYMLAAWSVLILGILAFIIAALGLAPHSLITYHGFQIGSAIEALLLSLALADRVRILREEREQLAADHDRLHQATRTDPLTGLSNRRHLEEALPSEVQQAMTGASGLALLIVDADHFKQYNDRYGHAQGDHLLKEIARAMRETAAPEDRVFRFGGEEFVILTRRPEQAGRLAEQIRQTIEVGTAAGAESRVTVSIGVAVLATGQSPAHLFERADQALYTAKAAGRNRVVLDDT
ncbi:MAG: diguanylate cyclase [Pseudomonadota bacterium]